MALKPQPVFWRAITTCSLSEAKAHYCKNNLGRTNTSLMGEFDTRNNYLSPTLNHNLKLVGIKTIKQNLNLKNEKRNSCLNAKIEHFCNIQLYELFLIIGVLDQKMYTVDPLDPGFAHKVYLNCESTCTTI